MVLTLVVAVPALAGAALTCCREIPVLDLPDVLDLPAGVGAPELAATGEERVGLDARTAAEASAAEVAPVALDALSGSDVLAALMACEASEVPTEWQIMVVSARAAARVTAGNRRMVLPGLGVPPQQTSELTRP